jgi:ABC-type lipoprotein export system ATPase subunit
MTEEKNYAQFWKCALQVNPYDYAKKFRGENTSLAENGYNRQILDKCLELDIKVVGIADHGIVSCVEGLKNVLSPHGIIVFPGFEIASNDTIHFVCLFDENTTETELNRYLGSLDLLDPANGIRPSKKSAEELIKKVVKLGGFIYAAHCTNDSGLLKRRLNHVWQLPELRAAQIPGSVEDLKNADNGFYYQVLRNKNPDYKRDSKIAPINAKDVARADDLTDNSATCFIKMTKPCFDSFKNAFQDAESRVRLNSDVPEKYFSCIKNVKITGGYLDGLEIDFSDHLNAVIGGRGSGKSTLLECIRYVLDKKPSLPALKQHDDIIKENLGKAKARIEIRVKSSKMNGKEFVIARRFGENISVKDDAGAPSSFMPKDLLPNIEIYGQNEIYEIAQAETGYNDLLARFLSTSLPELEKEIQAILDALADNRKKLLEEQEEIAALEDDVAKLSRLTEQAKIFDSLGIKDKLKIIPLLEIENQILYRSIEEEAKNLNSAFESVKDSLPETIFLSGSTLKDLPHSKAFRKIKDELDSMRKAAEALLLQWQDSYLKSKNILTVLKTEIERGIKTEEENLELVFKDIPSSQGKSGKQIGITYQNLLKEIERIRPKQESIKMRKASVEEIKTRRQSLLDSLSEKRAQRGAQFDKSLKALNKRLEGKLRLTVEREADRRRVIDFLLKCNLDGIGEGRLAWIKTANDFSPVKLAAAIQNDKFALTSSAWGISDTTAKALARLSPDKLLQLQELDLPDKISIFLNTAHEGGEDFKPLEKLSRGQKCTAILHLLLLQNQDPLLVDQPEDNLDNAFIADRIVSELRSAKIERQFIFATHNANIPVFGDAEWIGVLTAEENQAQMPKNLQGAIDFPAVKAKAAVILEGGETAFNQRKEKYGF